VLTNYVYIIASFLEKSKSKHYKKTLSQICHIKTLIMLRTIIVRMVQKNPFARSRAKRADAGRLMDQTKKTNSEELILYTKLKRL